MTAFSGTIVVVFVVFTFDIVSVYRKLYTVLHVRKCQLFFFLNRLLKVIKSIILFTVGSNKVNKTKWQNPPKKVTKKK